MTAPLVGAKSRAAAGSHPSSLRGSVRSEWIKLSGLQSTWWLLAAAVASIAVLGLGNAVGVVVAGPAGAGALEDPLAGSLSGVGTAQLVVLGLGALVVTGEYATGTMRGTLAVTPFRLRLAAAKTLAASTRVALAGLLAVLVTFAACVAVLAGRPGRPPLFQADVARALLGAVVYLALVAVIGTAAGLLVRSTAGACVLAGAVLYVPALLVTALPRELGTAVLPWTPANAGSALMQVGPSDLLPWWAGLAVLTLYALALLALGTLRLVRRDA